MELLSHYTYFSILFGHLFLVPSIQITKMNNPNDITLSNPSKMFEYEKFSRMVDTCDDVNELRKLVKSSYKLYLKQQEVVSYY